MSRAFKALVVNKSDEGQSVAMAELADGDLMDGDVTVDVDYSTLNYKDGLALTGAAPIIRHFPLIPGIDFAGTVAASDHADFAPGQKVVLNGWGVGEKHHGGYAERARVPGDWLVHLPEAFDTRQAMAIGTAGYTAMLAVMALEAEGVTPDSGEILVTGAAGGVGSVAVALLAKLGYRAVASTGRADEADYLSSLGAAEVIDRGPFAEAPRPLAKERWAGAIDVAGSTTLANMLSQMRYDGAVAACGLAQGMDLPASVAPFILRGVRLIGIDSVMAPKARREAAWQRLAQDLDTAKLDAMTKVVPLSELPSLAGEILTGQVRGRTVVDVHV